MPSEPSVAASPSAVSEASRTQQLAEAFQHAPMFMAVFSGPDFVFSQINEAYRQLIGHRDVLGKPLREAMPEIKGQGFHERRERVFATGERFVGRNLSVRLARVPGQPLEEAFVDVTYEALRGPDGVINGLITYGLDVTAQALAERQAAASLQTSEAKYRSLFDSIDQAFAVLDIIRDEEGQAVDYRFVEINPAMERHTGWQDARGKTAQELIPGLESHWPERYGRVERTGEPIRFVQGAVGMGRVFDAYAFRIDSAGYPQVAILFQDVTEQRNVAATLARLSEQRRLALDSAQMGWWHLDVGSGELHMDDRFRAIFDVDEQSDLYTHVVRRIHPDDRERVEAAVQAAVRPTDPVPYAIEYRVVHRDGVVRWVAARGQASHEGEGEERRMGGFSGTAADITDDKAAGDAVRASEARFRQLADAMPQIVWTARPDGVLDYTNRRWYEFIQKDEADWNVANWGERVHPEDLPGTAVLWQASLASGEPYSTEFRVQGGDGEYRWFLVRALAIRDERGEITRWYGTCTDVQLQRKILEQNAQLLDSERAARSEAERVGRMKDEFLATLSHELRTPLNAILGWTQVLRGDPANSEDVESGLATIERNARAQNAIIEDLLDMSRIISGKVRLDVQPLDLDQVVRTAVDSMEPAAAAKNIRLQALIDPEARMISGDPNRLQQVFWNLLSNAIKFTPKGGRVQVVLERIHSHLEVSIVDSGEGIAPEFLPHVFDRFRQQDASTTRKHGGLGLGLAIVKQLVELHGGSIHVDSAGPGRGTTFRVMLPLWVVRTPAEGDAESGGTHPHARRDVALPIPVDRLNLAGIRVLVVDDEADARTLIKRLLEDRGALVRMAGSVAQALELLTADPPDVLVSDIGMPGQDGFALIRLLRARPAVQGGKVPAVALTAYARSEDRLKVILEGFQAHLAKPVEAAELLALVASLAGRVAGA